MEKLLVALLLCVSANVVAGRTPKQNIPMVVKTCGHRDGCILTQIGNSYSIILPPSSKRTCPISKEYKNNPASKILISWNYRSYRSIHLLKSIDRSFVALGSYTGRDAKPDVRTILKFDR